MEAVTTLLEVFSEGEKHYIRLQPSVEGVLAAY
jgi:hypothetical protein